MPGDRCRLYNNAGTAFFYFSAKNVGCESIIIGTALSNGYLYSNSPNPNASSILDVGGSSSTTYYSFFNRLRTAGNDPNTIWRTSTAQPSICLTTSSTSAYIYHSIGNGSIKTITGSGGFGINTGENVNPRCSLEVHGIACIHNGSPYAVTNNFMQSGSLTIGGTTANYGTGGNQWSGNTAGLMMECPDYTKIAVHDASTI